MGPNRVHRSLLSTSISTFLRGVAAPCLLAFALAGAGPCQKGTAQKAAQSAAAPASTVTVTGGGGGAPAGCPAALPLTTGLQTWLSAASLGGAVSGQPVPTWPDCSGAQHDADQALGTRQPTFNAAAGGNPAYVGFSGGGGSGPYLRVPNAGVDFTGGISVVAVVRFPATFTSYGGLFAKGWDLSNRVAVATDNFFSTNYLFFESESVGYGTGVAANLSGVWVIVSAAFDGVNGSLYLNGGTLFSMGSMSYATSPDDLIIGGAQSGPTYYTGNQADVAEAAFYRGRISDGDRKAVECAMKTRLGVTAYAATCP